jgi:hypothetical protein
MLTYCSLANSPLPGARFPVDFDGLPSYFLAYGTTSLGLAFVSKVGFDLNHRGRLTIGRVPTDAKAWYVAAVRWLE